MTFTYRYRKQIIIGFFSLLFLTCGGCFLYFSIYTKPVTTKKVLSVSKKEKKEENKVDTTTFKVDIKGQIVNPGIYTLAKESRVMDAIVEAGGLTDLADTSVINLSKRIEDEMVIIVYSYEEVADFARTKEVEKQVQDACSSGGKYELPNDACITESENSGDTLTTESSGPISINTASKEELMTLPGIGEAKALAIIEYRKTNGLFEKIEDIQKVSGIGESLFAKIQENITT